MTEVIGIDHIYISVTDLGRSAAFYDYVLMTTLGFRKHAFTLSHEPHLHYYNRDFGYVLRPSRNQVDHDPYAPGLHHLCLRVNSADDVIAVATQLRNSGLEASEARQYPEYAPDYWATYFTDPDGIRLEVTNYRLERQERHRNWDKAG